MQQLNVLPINVSQSVDSKDDAAVLISSSSNDDFSQHIDLHLNKNKDVSSANKLVQNEKNTVSNQSSVDEQATEKTETNAKENIVNNENAEDEINPATDETSIAASGNKSDVKANSEKVDDSPKAVDESELLISFLAKADKTLVDVTKLEQAKLNGFTEDNDGQLISKSTDLATGLSKVAQAISASSTAQNNAVSNQNSDNALQELANKDEQLKIDNAHIENKALIENTDLKNKENAAQKVLDVLKSTTEDASKTSILNDEKIVKKNTTDSLAKQQEHLTLAQQNHSESFSDSDLANKIASQISQSNEGETQTNLAQSLASATVKSTENEQGKTTLKFTSTSQTSLKEQNPFEQDSIIDEQIAQLIENEKGNIKLDTSTASASVAFQGKSKPFPNDSVKQSIAESLSKESVLTEVDVDGESTDKLIDKHQEMNTKPNKEEQAKVLPKTNTGFAINGSMVDSHESVTQSSYSRIDQQAAEIFNPTSSAEISQSQKTNTQLHQETISIFRKDFSDAVKDKVMLIISQKLQQFDITLDPPELGNMQVRVNLQGEQASVNFIVQNQQAKDALEQNMHKLKELLAEQGVDVGDANVEQQSQQADEDIESQENQSGALARTLEADDVVEHTLSANMIGAESKGVDFYA